MIISIDAGITTGWAVLENNGQVQNKGLLKSNNLDMLKEIAEKVQPDSVVIEGPLIISRSQLSRDLEQVKKDLQRIFPDATWVLASDWKSTRWAVVPAMGHSQHERDAVHIGWYHLDQLRRNHVIE